MSATKRVLSVVKKYGLLLCLPLFLSAAYFYARSIYPQYKVSAKIKLKGAASGIKSKTLVQKAIDQLPVQVKFYDANSSKKELYGDSVPVKFVFGGSDTIKSETMLELAVLSDDQFTVNNNDTVSYHRFNEQFDEPYGRFRVVKNPQYKAGDQTFTLKLGTPKQVFNQFYNHLTVKKNSHNNVVTVSVLAGNPQKGVDFLNRLFGIYANTGPDSVIVSDEGTAMKNANEINENITTLKAKTTALKAEISKLREENRNSVKAPHTHGSVDIKQFKIYEAIEPYVKKPVDEFVQIPFVDEIEDPDLNDEVNEYNETELFKQHLLAGPQNNSAQIDSTNKKLMMLRSAIFEKTDDFIKNGNPGVISSRNPVDALIRSKEDSLNKLNRNIRAEMHKHAVTRAGQVKPQTETAGSKLVIIEKPGEHIEYIPVNTTKYYIMALLAAAVIIFTWVLIKILRKNSAQKASRRRGKLNDEVNNLSVESK